MKKLIFILLLFVSFQTTKAQSRIGYSEAQIKNDFSTYSFEEGYTDDGTKYIYFKDDRALIVYYFGENGLCTITGIFPLTQGSLNFFVQQYNKQYVIISSTQWQAYLHKGILEINLRYPKTGEMPYFLITPNNN